MILGSVFRVGNVDFVDRCILCGGGRSLNAGRDVVRWKLCNVLGRVLDAAGCRVWRVRYVLVMCQTAATMSRGCGSTLRSA